MFKCGDIVKVRCFEEIGKVVGQTNNDYYIVLFDKPPANHDWLAFDFYKNTISKV